MSKPSVFFSHSSKDFVALTELKRILIENTGGAFDIFLSSDGQSIPLGKNWVFKIQEALESTAAVFVFLSPHALNSSWVPFESGFAYSKDIRVVPVAIGGLKIENIPPPLSLLNGFSVQSCDDLNKLVGTINDVLDHSHSFRFSAMQHTEIFGLEGNSRASLSQSIVSEIYVGEEFRVDVPENYQFTGDGKLPYGDTQDGAQYLTEMVVAESKARGWQYSFRFNCVQISGASVMASTSGEYTRVSVSILGISHAKNRTFLNEIVSDILKLSFEHLPVRISLNYSLSIEANRNKISHLIENSEIKLAPEGGYQFKNYRFDVANRNGSANEPDSRPARITIIPQENHFDFVEIETLLELLLDKSIVLTQ